MIVTSTQLNEYTVASEGTPVMCILTGVYLAITGTNICLLRKKRYRVLVLYSIVQLVLTTLYCIMMLLVAPSRNLRVFNLPGSTGFNELSSWPKVIGEVTFVLNTWVSDAFLLYRCYVIYLGNARYALAFPVLLYLATIGSSLAWLVVNSVPGGHYGIHAVTLTGICYWSCSTAMNICTSYLISARLWMHRKSISKFLGSHRGAFYLGYITLTLESTLLYTAFAIIVLVVFSLDSPLGSVFIPVLGIIQAIAPSLIIYRIARGFSFETDEDGSIAIGTLQFAPVNSTYTITRSFNQDIELDGARVQRHTSMLG